MFVAKQVQKQEKELSYDYIRGLIEGEGCFTFSTNRSTDKNGYIKIRSVPAFAIGMHERDFNLLTSVRDKLKLKNRVYIYAQTQKDGFKRGKKAFLIVREYGNLKNIIIPLFYKKLFGNKKIQFEDWMEKIGSDPYISKKLKFIHFLYLSGYYEKIHEFD